MLTTYKGCINRKELVAWKNPSQAFVKIRKEDSYNLFMSINLQEIIKMDEKVYDVHFEHVILHAKPSINPYKFLTNSSSSQFVKIPRSPPSKTPKRLKST